MHTCASVEDIRPLRGKKGHAIFGIALAAENPIDGVRERYMEITIDLGNMGLCWDDDFEMPLGKSLDRDFASFMSEKSRFPNGEELQAMIEGHSYFMIDKPKALRAAVYRYPLTPRSHSR